MESLKLQTSNLLCSLRSFVLRWYGQFYYFHATWCKNYKNRLQRAGVTSLFLWTTVYINMCAWYTVRKFIVTPKWRCWWSNILRVWNTRHWTDSEFAWTLSCYYLWQLNLRVLFLCRLISRMPINTRRHYMKSLSNISETSLYDSWLLKQGHGVDDISINSNLWSSLYRHTRNIWRWCCQSLWIDNARLRAQLVNLVYVCFYCKVTKLIMRKIWKFRMKFGHLILRKIIKFVATNYHILSLF